MCIDARRRALLSDSLEDGYCPHGDASWRNGALSDWTIVVGTRRFPVHRFVIAVGPRSSAYFYNRFAMGYDSAERCTTLEIGRALLCRCAGPCACPLSLACRIADIDRQMMGLFPAVLEFMYEGDLPPGTLTETTVVPVLVLADYLQVEALRALADAFLRRTFDAGLDAAHAVLLRCLEMNHSMGDIVQACLAHLARRLSYLSYDQWRLTSPDVIAVLLDHDDLVVDDGDALACFLARYLRDFRDTLTPAQTATLLGFLQDDRFPIAGGDALFFLDCLHDSVADDDDDAKLRKVHRRCLASIARDIDRLPQASFLSLSPATVAGVLDQDDLQVESEDDVFDRIATYLGGPRGAALPADERRLLWKTCRFAFLSASRLMGANAAASTVPKDLVSVGAIMAKALQDNDHDALDSVSPAFARRLRRRGMPTWADVAGTGALVLSNRRRTVRVAGASAAPGHVTALGRQPVDTSVPRDHSWLFQIDADGLRNVQGMYLGVSVAPPTLSSCARVQLGGTSLTSWAVQCTTGKKVHAGKPTAYGPMFARGDTIGMDLSCRGDGTASLSFTKNGVRLGVAFDGIRGVVVPAVTLYRRDQQVSLYAGNASVVPASAPAA
ncbi:BTB And C-terminal Kelch [Plasmodiophora brassicae]